MKIIVSSKNPVKINATKKAFKVVFPDEKFTISGISVPSDVSNQPISDEETLQGAVNRANNAHEISQEADYWVGIEGGIQNNKDGMMCFGWVVIRSKDLLGKGRSASFFLPPNIINLIETGMNLGDADEIVFGKRNSKIDRGTIGVLTHDLIDRTSLYTDAVIIALIPFVNRELYETI